MLGSVAIFVPGISVKKMGKAITLPVDSIYFDLEDSVAPDQKDEARDCLRNFLAARDFGQKCLLARVNSVGSPWWNQDVAALAGCRKLSALLLPNADLASVSILTDQLERFDSHLKIVPLIETARGLEEAREAVLVSSRVSGLQFGGEDYTASLGIRRTLTGEEIAYARVRLTNLARAYNLDMMDTPFTAIQELELLAADCRRAVDMGFTGKAVIHPGHIEIVRQAFRPDEADIEKARRLIAAYEQQTGERAGVFALDGAMIDAPIIQRARNTLKKAGL
ncbi:MAG: CoA ester lyase [Candidatus Adiutrix sp.]|jgi:citrate lyase subunit beta/citryl-CoA lyase|nr:CoA ester lyase [Candidatus Adiutrix sp.]